MSHYNRLVEARSADRAARQPFKLQVIGANINRGVVVSVAGEFAHATLKNRLFRPIGVRHMLALRTLLRGVTRVNKNNTDSHSLRLVFNKCLKLGKAPFVKPLALGFFQFALGRTSAFRLKLRAQNCMSARHFFPMFRTVKLSPAICSLIHNPQINTNKTVIGVIGWNFLNVFAHYDMQPPSAFAVLNHIGTATLPSFVLLIMLGNRKRDSQTALQSQQRNLVSVKPKSIRTLVRANWAEQRLRLVCFFPFAQKHFDRIQCFSRFASGRNSQKIHLI